MRHTIGSILLLSLFPLEPLVLRRGKALPHVPMAASSSRKYYSSLAFTEIPLQRHGLLEPI